MRKVDTNCENVPQRGKKDIWWFPVKDTSVSDWGMGEGESAAGDICLLEKHFTTHSVSLREHRSQKYVWHNKCLSENTELLSEN